MKDGVSREPSKHRESQKEKVGIAAPTVENQSRHACEGIRHEVFPPPRQKRRNQA